MVNRPKLEVEKFLYICTHQSFQKCIKKKCKYHTVKIYSSQEIDGCARSPEQFLSTLRSFFRLPEYQTRQTKQKLCGVGKNCYGTVHSRLFFVKLKFTSTLRRIHKHWSSLIRRNRKTRVVFNSL